MDLSGKLRIGRILGPAPATNFLSKVPFHELRTPHGRPPVTKFLFSGCRYTVKFLSDDPRRNGSDAVELLKIASHRPKLIDGLDALSVEQVPGKLRQIETLNEPFAGWEMTRHLLFLSLTDGGTHLSAVGAESLTLTISCHTPFSNPLSAQFLKAPQVYE
jgi:hypothetical protein